MSRRFLPARIPHNALFPARNQMLESFDSLFDSMFNDMLPGFSETFGNEFFRSGSYPKVDVIDTTTSVTIEAAIPGLKPEDVDIEVKENILTISGKKQTQQQADDSRYVFRELKRSHFSRSFTLSDNLDKDKIDAVFEDGLLKLTIPKIKVIENEEPQAKKIEIRRKSK